LLSLIIDSFKKDTLFCFFFIISIFYSLIVNSLGALTTIAIPPIIEAKSYEFVLPNEEVYPLEKSVSFLLNEGTNSFIYRTFLQDLIPAWLYYLLIFVAIFSFIFNRVFKFLSLDKEKLLKFIFEVSPGLKKIYINVRVVNLKKFSLKI